MRPRGSATARKSKIFRRWLAVGAILLVCLLYARPLRSYLRREADAGDRTAEVHTLDAEKRELQHNAGPREHARGARARSAPARSRAARASSSSSSRESTPGRDPGTGRCVRRASGRPGDRRAAARPAAASLPARRAFAARSGARPSPSRRRTTHRGEPFPTTYCLTCPHARRRRSRGSRPPAGSSAGARRRCRAAARRESRAGDGEQRAVRDGAAAPRTRGALPWSSAIGGPRRPARLKCLHAHAAFALARPGYLARGARSWPKSSRSGRALACRAEHATSIVTMADGPRGDPAGVGGSRHRRLEAAAGDRRRYRSCSTSSTSCSTASAAGSARRSRSKSSPWRTARPTAGSSEALAEREARPGWPAQMTIVQDAAFHLILARRRRLPPVSVARLPLAPVGETMFPPRAPSYSPVWENLRFPPPPAHAHRPKDGL